MVPGLKRPDFQLGGGGKDGGSKQKDAESQNLDGTMIKKFLILPFCCGCYAFNFDTFFWDVGDF